MSEASSKPYRSVWTSMVQVPFRHDWIDAGGVSTRYVEAGSPDRPAVIMLHGTGGSLDTFCANIAPFAEHFHVLAIDMLGSGFTAKPDRDYLIPDYVAHLRDFMIAKTIRRASLVGVSLGSWVAARFAHTHPEMTDKVVMLSPSGMISNPETLKKIRSSRTQAVEDPTWENVRTIMTRLVHDPANVIDDHVAIRQSAYRSPAMKTAMPHILILQTPEVRTANLLKEDEWKEIQAPILAIASLEDKGDYLKTAYRIAELNPRARTIDMAGVNHWPHFEDPATFNRIAIDFLRS